MGCVDQPSLDRPRVIDADAQLAALHALRIAVSGAKRSALESDEQLPRVRLDVGKPLPTSRQKKRSIYAARSRSWTRKSGGARRRAS
jgi:hypothetical protein